MSTLKHASLAHLPSLIEHIGQRSLIALSEHFAARSDEHFYAAGFIVNDGFCLCDFRLPRLVCNSEEQLALGTAQSRSIERWDCASWPELHAWDDPDSTQKLESLNVSWKDLSETQEAKIRSSLERLMIAKCKQLTKALQRDHAHLAPNFAVLILDDDAKLTAKCVSRRQFFVLFPHLDAPSRERSRIKALPLAEQVAIYLDQMQSDDSVRSSNGRSALREIGRPAVLALAQSLEKRDNKRWSTLSLLREIAVRDDAVIACLRRGFLAKQDEDTPRSHYAHTLANLGDVDFMFEHRGDWDLGELAKALVCSLSETASRRMSLTYYYAAIERLLTLSPQSSQVLKTTLMSSSFGNISKTELGAALIATQHQNPGIRRQAVYVLGNKSLGKSRKIDQALSACLSDPHPRVRFNAMVGLKLRGSNIEETDIQRAAEQLAALELQYEASVGAPTV